MPLHLSKFFKPALLALFCSVVFLFTPVPLSAAEVSDSTFRIHFDRMKTRLIEDGIRSETIDRHLSDERFEVLRNLLKVNIRQPSGTAGYERFVGDESVRESSDFYLSHRELLDSLLADNPVDPMVVVAILQVESGLGKFRGTYPLFNVFASLTLLDTDPVTDIAPAFWDAVLEGIPAEEHESSRAHALKRARSKSRWAYRELKTLLKMAENGQMDPLETRGSWAGAYGMAQFIPTSAEAYARDGDGDGRIDLDTVADAAASIANYLKIHKYSRNDPAKRRKAVWHYNHSEEYVDCILTLANSIEARVAQLDK